MEGIDIYPLENQLEKNTPELPKLNVFQIILQLDLVFEGAFVPGTCNLYYKGDGVFLCKVYPGILELDLAMEGAFAVWSLQLLL